MGKFEEFRNFYPHLTFKINKIYYKNIHILRFIPHFIKNKVHLAQSESVHAIYQEFYASIFLSNLQSIITNDRDVQERIENISAKRKHDYQENRTSALFYLKEKLVLLFTQKSFDKFLKYIKNKIIKNILPVRYGRKYNRKSPFSKPTKYIPNRKTIA